MTKPPPVIDSVIDPVIDPEIVAGAIHEITSALASPAIEAVPQWATAGLADGTAGILAALRVLDADADAVEARTFELLETTALRESWFNGLAGIGAVFEHLGEGELNEQFDEPLAAYLDISSPLSPRYDLGDGWIGVARYFTRRPRTDLTRKALARALGLVRFSSEPLGAGYGVRGTDDAKKGEIWNPNGRFDLGAAHGLAGVVDVLAEMTVADVPEAAELCAGAARGLISQCAPALPTHVGEPGPARLAWCYGDLGASIALVAAGDALGDSEIRSAGISAGLRAAARLPGEPGHRVVDAGLCHGAAGAGHVMQRLYVATGMTEFRDTATAWFTHVLAQRDHGTEAERGIGRITEFEPGWPEPAPRYVASAGFLCGAAGVV
ncbi:MAG TPA: lanthionine synthetase LanC family protein, partial [Kofleriaceae bacterium]